MKSLYYTLGVLAIGLCAYLYLSREHDVEPDSGQLPVVSEGLRKAEKNQQIRWKRMSHVELDSREMTNIIADIVASNSREISENQRVSLADKLTNWLYYLSSGDLESYLTFRDPDYYGVDSGIDDIANDYSEISNSYSNYIDSGAFVRFHSFIPDSVLVDVRGSQSKISGLINSSDYAPGGYVVYQYGKQKSKFKYYRSPKDVYDLNGSVAWAKFCLALVSSDYVFVINMQLALYWSPEDSKWQLGELSISMPPGHEVIGVPYEKYDEAMKAIMDGTEVMPRLSPGLFF